MAIEVCTGHALMNGHIKKKVFDKDKYYLLNHQVNTIYNDVLKYDKENIGEALTKFGQFPAQDTTILVRGKDGQVVK